MLPSSGSTLLMAGRRLLAIDPSETDPQARVLGSIVLAGCAIDSASNDFILRTLPRLATLAPRRHQRWVQKDRLLRRPSIERYRSLALLAGASPEAVTGPLIDDVEAVELVRSVVLGDHVDPSTYRERVLRARLGVHLDASDVTTITVQQLTPAVGVWALETASTFLTRLANEVGESLDA
jgi:hypothetical protein